MASIKAFQDDSLGIKQNEIVCSFCGSEEVTAGWAGAIYVFSCHECAVNILPKLMADGIVEDTPPHNLNDTLEKEFRKIRKCFQKAAFIAATKKGK